MGNPPSTLRLDAGAVGRLNWQPRVCPTPLPCIASRIGDVLEVIFGPSGGLGYNGNASHDLASWDLTGLPRHRYQLEPLNDSVLIGTLIQPKKETQHNG